MPALTCPLLLLAEEIKLGQERWKESITPQTPEEAAIAAGEPPAPPPSPCAPAAATWWRSACMRGCI